jgi:DNA invertase Pin-like site-specific DNA recombinase
MKEVVVKQQANNAAIYLRLSRDDGGDAESNSIGTQREMLTRYAKDSGFVLYGEYVDDGISGTTFERDSFKRMINDIEEGKIQIVVCKDLSRLGRNNALVSYFTEIFFPQNDIRFIALNDGIDSEKGENEIMGFRSVINEFYSRDISKKIRSSFKVRAQKGAFIGSYAPYGYLKNPEDKHHLIVDEYAAENVRKMFALAKQGISPKKIATILTKENVLIPMAYLHQHTGKWGSSYDERFPCFWKAVTVHAILKNRVYMGHMVGCKQTIKSFKNKKLQNNPEEDWIIVENTHEGIVSEDDFWHVQELISIKRPPNLRTKENIFVGKLQCPDCDKRLGYQSSRGSDKAGTFVCNSYRRNTKACSSHRIMYESLHDMVCRDIRHKAEMAKSLADDFDEYLQQLAESKTDVQENNFRRELDKAKTRVSELETIIKRLFEQNALGIMPDDRFASMFGDYNAEQKALLTKIDELKARLGKQKSDSENAKQFFLMLQKYTDFDRLTTQMISDLIDCIVVHERVKTDEGIRQRVVINYRFGGMTEIAT